MKPETMMIDEMIAKGTAVVVTNKHRGIYFGYVVSELEGGNALRLERARHCYRYTYHQGHEGTWGLASGGPADGSQVGPRVTMTVRDVASVAECTPEAVERWEAAKWKP